MQAVKLEASDARGLIEREGKRDRPEARGEAARVLLRSGAGGGGLSPSTRTLM